VNDVFTREVYFTVLEVGARLRKGARCAGACSGTEPIAVAAMKFIPSRLYRIIALIFALGLGVAVLAGFLGGPRIVLGPSLHAPSSDAVNVWWHPSFESDVHRVEYGTSPDALGESVTLRRRTRYPVVELTGLVPGRTYHYRVVSGAGDRAVASEVRSFALPPRGATLTLAMWADNQHGADIFGRRTVPLLARLRPHVLLAAGDLVDDGSDPDDWRDHLYRPARELLATVPWFPVRGNHDGESEAARDHCPLPETDRWYARTVGPLRIVVLDTNVPHDPASEQHAWLRREVGSEAWRDATFRLVSFHHPPFTSLWDRTGYDGEWGVREHLVPILEAAGADLVVCGHAHAYERGARPRPDGGSTHYLVIGGGGGTLDTVGVHPWPHIEVAHARHHVVVAEVSAAGMRVRALDSLTEEVLDAFTIPASVPAPARAGLAAVAR
jgi:hypothetical protein